MHSDALKLQNSSHMWRPRSSAISAGQSWRSIGAIVEIYIRAIMEIYIRAIMEIYMWLP